MYNDDFDFYPEPQRNMRFEKPMHGPPGRGPPGHHMRPPGPPMRRRMMPDMPPNFRGPREPMGFDDFNPPLSPHGMGPPMGMGRGPPGPPFSGNSPQHMNQYGSPRGGGNQQPQGMPGKGPFQKPPPMIPHFPPPGFAGGGSGPPNRPQHSGNHMPQNSGNSFNSNTPNIDLDFWVETKSSDGKVYYYNAETRESSWTKPTNCKVISQEQIEAMAASASNSSDSVSNEKNSQVNPAFFPMGPMAVGPMGAPGMGMLPPPAFGMPPPPFAMPPPGFPPFAMPPMAFPGVPVVGPNSSTAASNSQTSVTTSVADAKNDMDLKNSEKSDWSEYRASDGRVYYFNRITQQSTYEKPAALIEAETENNELNKDVNSTPQKSETTTDTQSDETPFTSSNNSGMEVEETSDSHMKNDLNSEQEIESNKDTDNSGIEPMYVEEKHAEELTAIQEKREELEMEQENSRPQKPVDKSRPVSSTPIPNSGWCVVWTGDNRVFYFHASTKTSVWMKPKELEGRADVDKLVQEPPQLANSQQVDSVKDEKKSENDSGPEAKRIKREDSENEQVKNQTEPAVVKNSITPGKESAIEAELKAAKERSMIALDVRMKLFKDLLVEKDVSAFSTWEKELHKIVFDPRYLLLASKERKQCFERYVKERAEEERNQKRKKVRERKDDYRKLLEESSLTAKSTFSDFAQRYGKDERFKMIEKMRERESIFNDYIQDLRRKERDERSSQREKLKKDFIELLKEKGLEKNSRYGDIKKSLSDDPRYKAVDSGFREEWFKEFIRSNYDVEDDVRAVKEREKQERVEASIREREKEVQRTLSTHLRERDKERELHKHDEAVQHFKALLTDLVRTTDVSWHDVKKTLRKDHRYETVLSLERDERERVFDEHIAFLCRKKKEKFRELLDETPAITLTSTWKEVKKVIKDDPRCTKFSSSDRKCEKEFKEYLKDKMVAAKADFRELLKETKIITYKSRKLIEETDHLHDIEKVLQNDKRYLVLQCIEDERRTLLMSYIETLDRKGPPPPPTASEPSRRSTK